MDWDRLGTQLRREAREYLADIVAIIRSLKRSEGRIALLLFVAVGIMTVVWFITSLGFNPPNEHVNAFLRSLGQKPCRPINNFSGVVMFIDFVVLILLVVMSVGSLFSMIERMRQGFPREPRELIVLASLMLVAGIGGIAFMRFVC